MTVSKENLYQKIIISYENERSISISKCQAIHLTTDIDMRCFFFNSRLSFTVTRNLNDIR